MGKRGFTLLELVVTMAILGVIIGLAIPAVLDFRENNRLRGAAESLAQFISSSTSEAKRVSEDLTLSLEPESRTGFSGNLESNSSGWSKEMADPAYKNIEVEGADIDISSMRGTIEPPLPKEVELTHRNSGAEVRIEVNLLGNSFVCAPSLAKSPGKLPEC